MTQLPANELSITSRLQLEEFGITAGLRDKFFVGAGSLHLAARKHQNAVGHTDAGKAVRDENRQFPAGTFIRSRAQLDYLEEPDIFHDVFGHVPLLTNPAYADYMNEYGRIGLDAVENKGVKFLARLNWYTIEFGLIRKPDGIKIYGAGIVSSFGEAKYVAEDSSAHQLAFNLDRVLRTGYYIDDFQAAYFVVDQFEDLFDLLKRTDFTAQFDKLRAQPSHSPFEILPQDVVIRKGTGHYWRNFPSTKTSLK